MLRTNPGSLGAPDDAQPYVGTSAKVDDDEVGEADFRNGRKHAVPTPSSFLFAKRSGRQVRVTASGVVQLLVESDLTWLRLVAGGSPS
jgi:hypothetical protein